MSGRPGAQLMGQGHRIDAELTDRARRFVARVGITKASVRLRSSKDAIETLCSPLGRLRPHVVIRLREALEREEQLEREAS